METGREKGDPISFGPFPRRGNVQVSSGHVMFVPLRRILCLILLPRASSSVPWCIHVPIQLRYRLYSRPQPPQARLIYPSNLQHPVCQPSNCACPKKRDTLAAALKWVMYAAHDSPYLQPERSSSEALWLHRKSTEQSLMEKDEICVLPVLLWPSKFIGPKKFTPAGPKADFDLPMRVW
jgi:hypothetical protein